MAAIVFRPQGWGTPDRDRRGCEFYPGCPNDVQWIIRPDSPAFAAPERGTCSFHLEGSLEKVVA